MYIGRNARCEGEEGRVEFGLALNEKRHDPAAAGATKKRLAGGIRPDRDRGIRRAGDGRHAGRGGSYGAAGQGAGGKRCLVFAMRTMFPSGQAFGVVAVNEGLPNNTNPCLEDEISWAQFSVGGTRQPKASLYVNTADPGNHGVTDWPASNTEPRLRKP
ncbi:MAG TPA: hypothetical protein VK594_08730 [Streptosporangiaceae bacterium]|nr:hypothetical protein [Streptosporangiaceae bacterium]